MLCYGSLLLLSSSSCLLLLPSRQTEKVRRARSGGKRPLGSGWSHCHQWSANTVVSGGEGTPGPACHSLGYLVAVAYSRCCGLSHVDQSDDCGSHLRIAHPFLRWYGLGLSHCVRVYILMSYMLTLAGHDNGILQLPSFSLWVQLQCGLGQYSCAPSRSWGG